MAHTHALVQAGSRRALVPRGDGGIVCQLGNHQTVVTAVELVVRLPNGVAWSSNRFNNHGNKRDAGVTAASASQPKRCVQCDATNHHPLEVQRDHDGDARTQS